MRISVLDDTALRAPSARNIRLYLRTRGWERPSERQAVPDVWALESGHGTYEVIAPSSRDARDYTRLVGELLRTLAIVEDRSELAVLRDLLTLNFDIQYVHTHPGGPPGTAPLAAAADAFAAAQSMLSAAVSTLENPKLVLPPRRPTSATNLMSRVLAGPTTEGSYVLSLWVPVPPRLTQEEDAVLFEVDDQPFERSVTLWLNRSLRAAAAAATRVLLEDVGVDAFMETRRDGVSANLLESVVAISGDQEQPVQIDFAWSLDRPVRNVPARIGFSDEVIPVLREAARELRLMVPEEETRLRGNVVRLHREGNLGAGEVTIAGIATDDPVEKLRRVTVELSEADYQMAITAHKTYADVEVTGTLVQRGTRTHMRNPHGFTVRPEPD